MSEEVEPGAGEQLAPYKLEGARSSRSSCKTCRRKIEKGTLRLGVLIEGPFGQGYLWHHLKCAAKRRIEDVEQAYAEECWKPGLELPPLAELRALAEKSAEERAQKREAPYVERAPSARSKCKHCGEPIAEGELRVAVLRSVEFYNQVRSGPILVHTRCVRGAVHAPDSATEPEGFAEALRANSRGMEAADVERALGEIGEL
jgi:hypothetical protein